MMRKANVTLLAFALACAAIPIVVVAPALPGVMLLHDHGHGLHLHALQDANAGRDHGHAPCHDDGTPGHPHDHDDGPCVVIVVPRAEAARSAAGRAPVDDLDHAPCAAVCTHLEAVVVQDRGAMRAAENGVPPPRGTLSILRRNHALLI